MKSIIIINSHMRVGGVERSLVDLLSHVDHSKYSIDLLLLEGGGEYTEEIPNYINVIVKDTRPAFGPFRKFLYQNILTKDWFAIKCRTILILARLIVIKAYKLFPIILGIKKKYDIAIAYRIGLSADIIAYGVNAKQKICWWHHGAICEYHDTKSWLKLWGNFDQLVTVSYGVKQILQNLSKDLEPKLKVIPNIVDSEKIRRIAMNLPNPYGDYNGIKFVTVGRFVIEKHLENVVYATLKMIKAQVDFRWYLVGDGEEYSKIEELIKSYDLESSIILCGKKENPYPYIKHADILVHTSHIESQGLVILEAMTLGTPCVITQSVGPSEFIIDGTNGIMVEPNVSSLVNGINRLMNNTKLQDTIVLNAQNTVIEKFSPEKIIRNFESLIK